MNGLCAYMTKATQTDYYETGKLYPKLNAYMTSRRTESFGVVIYMGSSCQFKTKKRYKNWLLEQYPNLDIKIEKEAV